MYRHDDVGSLRLLYYVETFPYCRTLVTSVLIEETFDARRLSCIPSNEHLDEREE